MGLTAVLSGSANGYAAAGVSVSLLPSAVGQSAGGVFVAAVLVYLLAYLDLTTAVQRDLRGVRGLLVACILPLLLVFGGVVVFRVLQLL